MSHISLHQHAQLLRQNWTIAKVDMLCDKNDAVETVNK